MSQERPEIEAWLSERGYPHEAIAKIMERLDNFDDKVNRDSLFDAISTGEVDMEAIIKEALAE